jgi:hypothetical protein
MSGGEAFAHPLFLDLVVPSLMQRTSHRVSVLTNFSSDRRDLMRFARMTRRRLSVFSASLHLEYADAEVFADKAEWFVGLLDPQVRFVVNQVVLPWREEEALRCKELLTRRGLRWFPQLYKEKGRVVSYPEPKRLLPIIGAAPTAREANVAPSYRGKRCWAGVDYFVVDKDGQAWSCRTAKRHDEGFLGNLYAGSLGRLADAAVCPYDVCPCTVPANRGMIEGVNGVDGDVEREASA